MAAGRRGRRRLRRRALLRTVVDELVGKEVHLSRRPAFFFKQKTAYDILAWTGVQTCALPILLTTPPDKNGKVNPAILFTANLIGIKKIFKAGGAQAIAALAYGTQSIPRVSKIFGPGNQYVTDRKSVV